MKIAKIAGWTSIHAHSVDTSILLKMTNEFLQCVQQWHDEHPLKTYAQDFKDKFPKHPWDNEVNAPLDMYRDVIYEGLLSVSECTSPKMCKDCWNEPMPEACRQFYYFTDCPGDCGECWEERIEEGNDT